MGIIAHPDDEASFGGSLLRYRERGAETLLVCLTPGQAATHRGGAANDQQLSEMRRKEFAKSCEVLKVSRGVVLDYPDGKLHRIDLYNAVCELTCHVREFRPDVLITFGTEGGVTWRGNPLGFASIGCGGEPLLSPRDPNGPSTGST